MKSIFEITRGAGVIRALTMCLAVAGALILVSCSGDDNVTGSNSNGGNNGGNLPPNTVEISGFKFVPDAISVSVGTKVTWINRDATAHTVTSNDGSFPSSGNLSQGQSYEVTFSTLGTYPYHCSIHPSMTATVTVTP